MATVSVPHMLSVIILRRLSTFLSRFWRQIIGIIGMVSSPKVLPSSRTALAPVDRHVIDGLLEFLLGCGSEYLADLLLHIIDCPVLCAFHLFLQGRAGPKVTWGQIGAIGRMGQQVEILFTIKSQGINGGVFQGIIHMKQKIMVCLPIESMLPHHWSLAPDTVLQSEEDCDPKLICDRLPLG